MPIAFPSPADQALPVAQRCAAAPGHTGVPTAFISLCGFTALLSAAVRKAQATAQAD
ncbi:hypothetical protein [Acidovorax sp. CCYZU-2555]|uniref:hypothetical protein n=1 Tax=Acidovorax sp. CCYZU-2555 TaxID=2835042 RepID=UPI001BD0BE46|nr:hypothetical protein [Acidovorax sp. CCYZU-2555]MBS7777619.1 hypothetical protein [Acidovorax sp. CCYZU-2555]